MGRLLVEAFEEIGTQELSAGKDSVKKFCELTGHDFSIYLEKNLIPQGYLMTLIAPFVEEFFKIAGPRLMSKPIKGIIHTFSKVEYLAPFRLDQMYYGKMKLKSIEEKKGKMGEYFSVDFEVLVSSDRGEDVASDIHKFFMKT